VERFVQLEHKLNNNGAFSSTLVALAEKQTTPLMPRAYPRSELCVMCTVCHALGCLYASVCGSSKIAVACGGFATGNG
jgi:hypothetical protein